MQRKPTFIRFETLSPHPDSGRLSGIFAILHELRDDKQLTAYDFERLDYLVAWFAKHLAKPERFNASTSKGASRRATRGISYFKSTANKHITKVRELSAVVREYGYEVTQVETTRPGRIVYEDEHQIVAEPFND